MGLARKAESSGTRLPHGFICEAKNNPRDNWYQSYCCRWMGRELVIAKLVS